MKRYIKIFSIALLLVFCASTVLNLIAFDDDIHYKYGAFSPNIESGIQRHSIVAIYKKGSVEVGIEPIRIIDEFKYLYYSPISYSEMFYVNPNHIESCSLNVSLVLNQGDTVYNNGKVSPIKTVPKKMTIIQNNGNKYELIKTGFNDQNCLALPNIPLTEKLSFGPLFE